MSNTPELAVGISANADKLKKEVKEAEDHLKGFKKSSEGLGKSVSKSTATATKGMNNLKKGTISGTAAMTSFSRTIQDAPFGIMGVSNNITNLTEQFGYLKKKTGSASGALSAMLKDLKGFGGISLAISVATSLLLVFGDKIFATKDKVKDLKKRQDELTKSLDNYVFGLKKVDQANLKGSQSALKELTNLKLLRNQIENTSLSQGKRVEAVEEMRRIYPSYLSNISNEKALNGGLTETYNTLTSSILKRAKATASMNAIVTNSKNLLVIENQLSSKQNDLENKKSAFLKKTGKSFDDVNKKTLGRTTATKDTGKLVGEINKLNVALKELEKQKTILDLDNAKLAQNIEDFGGVVKPKPPKPPKPPEPPNTDMYFEEISAAYLHGVDEIQELIEENPIAEDPVDWEMYFNSKKLEEESLKMQEKLRRLNEGVNGIINNALKGTFAGIGEAIGEALANGSSLAEGLGKALLSGVGGMLTQLGTMAISIGVGIKAIKKSLTTLNPAAAITAGIGLIALGSIFKAGASKIGGGESNVGGVSDNTTTYSPSTSISSSSYTSNSNVITFQLKGADIYGSLKNFTGRNSNLGGDLSFT